MVRNSAMCYIEVKRISQPHLETLAILKAFIRQLVNTSINSFIKIIFKLTKYRPDMFVKFKFMT